MEINRLARQTGQYVLDGVVSVIDVENWKGYEDTSVTARLQAKYTDLIVFNKYVTGVSSHLRNAPNPGLTNSAGGRTVMSADSTNAWTASVISRSRRRG